MTEPERVRITSEASRRYFTSPVRTIEAGSMYLRGLRRAQLGLALGNLMGFLVSAGVLTVVLFSRVLEDIIVFGVPLPWLLHAYGFYPLIFVFAALYVRGARRNEERFLALGREGE